MNATPVLTANSTGSADRLSCPPAWAPLALALLLSVAVHSAVIASLEHIVAPLGGAGNAQRPYQPLRVTLVQQPQRSSDITPAKQPAAETRKLKPALQAASNAATGVPAATYFFAKNEVDEPATAISDVILRYPRDAFRAGVHGTVILEVFIDARGSVVRTRVVEALPKGIFEASAEDAISQLRYKPALKDGVDVRSRRLVQVVFDPDPPLLPPPADPASRNPPSRRGLGHTTAAVN